jgi:hypothetical protein
MAAQFMRVLRRAGTTLACSAIAAVSGPADTAIADDQAPPSLPVFQPHTSDWQPDYTVHTTCGRFA